MNNYILFFVIIVLCYLIYITFIRKETFIVGCSNKIPYTKKIKNCIYKDPYSISPYKFTNSTVKKMSQNRKLLESKCYYEQNRPTLQCYVNKHNGRNCKWN